MPDGFTIEPIKSVASYKHYFSDSLLRDLSTMTHGDSFNQSVQGRLRIGTPSARPCYSKYSGMAASPDPTACAVIQQNHTSSVFQAEYYGGFQEIQDDIYASVPGDQCLLDNTNPQNPPCVH
jgi:hypothetical protein